MKILTSVQGITIVLHINSNNIVILHQKNNPCILGSCNKLTFVCECPQFFYLCVAAVGKNKIFVRRDTLLTKGVPKIK